MSEKKLALTLFDFEKDKCYWVIDILHIEIGYFDWSIFWLDSERNLEVFGKAIWYFRDKMEDDK